MCLSLAEVVDNVRLEDRHSVTSLDHLGMSLKLLIETIEDLKKKEIHPVDASTTPKRKDEQFGTGRISAYRIA